MKAVARSSHPGPTVAILGEMDALNGALVGLMAIHAQRETFSEEEDEEIANTLLAKVMAVTVVDLLWEKAGAVQRMLQAYIPKMNKEKYLSLLRGLLQESESAAERSSDHDSE